MTILFCHDLVEKVISLFLACAASMPCLVVWSLLACTYVVELFFNIFCFLVQAIFWD